MRVDPPEISEMLRRLKVDCAYLNSTISKNVLVVGFLTSYLQRLYHSTDESYRVVHQLIEDFFIENALKTDDPDHYKEAGRRTLISIAGGSMTRRVTALVSGRRNRRGGLEQARVKPQRSLQIFETRPLPCLGSLGA